MKAAQAAVAIAALTCGCALDVAQELEDKYDSVTCGGLDVRVYTNEDAITYRLQVLSKAGDAWLSPAGKCEPTLCYEAQPGETVHVMNNSSQHDLIRWNVVIDETAAPCN